MATLDDLIKAYRRADAAVPAAERAAEAKVKAARDAREAARRALAAGIIDAWQSGVTQSEIARRTGYSREHIRRILRAGGIEPE